MRTINERRCFSSSASHFSPPVTQRGGVEVERLKKLVNLSRIENLTEQAPKTCGLDVFAGTSRCSCAGLM